MYEYSDVTVVLPSLNPDGKLIKTVESLISAGFRDIVIVNDGSDAEHTANFPDTERYPQCTVLNHWINRGKGAALKTAFGYVLATRRQLPGVVTVDGDGQHLAEDVRACAEEMCRRPDTVILGVRDFSLPGVPRRSVAGNRITSAVFRLGCGMKISDTQTGLRAIPSQYLPDLLKVKGDRFEYETNMLLELKTLDIPYAEKKIETVYIEDNKTSHFHPVRDSLRIYRLIFKYLLSSFSASLLDLAVFRLLIGFIANGLVCTVLARIVSSLFNYFVNFRLVFARKKTAGQTVIRYYVLAAAVMLVSGVSVRLISTHISDGWLLTLAKAGIDTILFLASFTVQREWVFGGKNKK